jgi:4'-phosphopantetheinyl transferase
VIVACALRRAADVPPGDTWLSPEERSLCAGFRVPKRRADFRLGRWGAKAALARRHAGPPPAVIPDADGAPVARVGGEALPLFVSLSHRNDVAAAAVASAPIGCDLEAVEPRSPELIADFFTVAEAARISTLSSRDATLAAALTWSFKEALLKLLRVGLRRDTWSVQVTELALGGSPTSWQRGAVLDTESGRAFPGCWRRVDGLVLTLVGDEEVERVELA